MVYMLWGCRRTLAECALLNYFPNHLRIISYLRHFISHLLLHAATRVHIWAMRTRGTQGSSPHCLRTHCCRQQRESAPAFWPVRHPQPCRNMQWL
jgi:hypothetical protein